MPTHYFFVDAFPSDVRVFNLQLIVPGLTSFPPLLVKSIGQKPWKVVQAALISIFINPHQIKIWQPSGVKVWLNMIQILIYLMRYRIIPEIKDNAC